MNNIEWVAECRYIADLTSEGGLVSTFNYDTACFKRYCEMQAKAAESEGFHDAAEYIHQCINDLEY